MDISHAITTFNGIRPEVYPDVFVAKGAHIIGDTKIGSQSSIWFNVVVRGDVHHVRIGKRTNIQDNSTVHVTEGEAPCIIGDNVTVGHNAIIHACTIENLCLIGMGAIILDQAVIQEGSFVAAGALVTPGKTFPQYSLIMGSPAKVVRELNPKEREDLMASADHYVQTAALYMQ
jgi:gamma-carbonic anhydrase